MSFESFWDLVPVKAIFLGVFIYIAYGFYKEAKSKSMISLVYYFFIVSFLSLYLSFDALSKFYPYGMIFDLSIVLFLSFIVIFLESKIKNLYIKRALIFFTLFLMILVPLFYLQHKIAVGGAVNADSFIAIFQTNLNEAVEYFFSFTSIIDFIFLSLVFVGLYWLTHIYTVRDFYEVYLKTYFFRFLALLLILVIIPFERGLYTYPVDVFIIYDEELKIVKNNLNTQSSRVLVNSNEVLKEEKGETYILIVGESLNKHHMSLYGYGKDTTPGLNKLFKKDEVFVFEGSYSNYPGTMASLSMALTSSNQLNLNKYTESVGFIDVFNTAGFETIWLGNQPLSNSYDMVLGYVANRADRVKLAFDTEFHVMSDKNQQPDGVLLPFLKEELERPVLNNRLIVMHLMGSHTNYCERYPKEFEIYKMSAFEEFWMRLTKGGTGHSKSCYDNSVIYNDFVVSEVVSMLKNTLNSNIGAMFYFADHSEDITRGKGHSSSNFSYEMVESPALMWLSKGYKLKYPEKVNAIKLNSDQLFPNDFVFDSLLGLAGVNVESDFYCPACDVTSSSYQLSPEVAVTMHGQLPYVSEDNFYSHKWLNK